MLSKWALISAVRGIGQCVTAPTNQRAWRPTGVLGKLTVAVCAILADRPCATAVPLAVVPAITETRTAASVARHARCPSMVPRPHLQEPKVWLAKEHTWPNEHGSPPNER